MKIETRSSASQNEESRRYVDLLTRLKSGKRLTYEDLSLARYLNTGDFRGANLSKMDLRGYKFKNADLRGADLTDADVTNANFQNAILSQTRMPRVKIEGKKVSLENELTLSAQHPWVLNVTPLYHGACSDCEWWNRCVLSKETTNEDDRGRESPQKGKYYRHGILITHGDELLGYIKLKGEHTFLATRTVRDASSEVIFWKGMVYGLDPILERWLLSASMPYYEERDIWRRADISNIVAVLSDSDFGVDNYRFISDVKIFPELDKLCARVKNGEEPFIDILTGENTTGAPQRAPQRTSLKEIVQWAIRSLQGSDPAKI